MADGTEQKKALIIATVVSFPATFEAENMRRLMALGYEVHVAAGDPIRGENPVPELRAMGVKLHRIADMKRNPFHPANVRAFRKLRALIRRERFDLVHCHTPVGGVLGRLAAGRERVPHILYTAHGFHFYRGAPLKNLLAFYPAERLLAPRTDVLITITKEDYAFAKKHLPARAVEYVPGVGVDASRFAKTPGVREETRMALGIRPDEILLLAVGELNENKNHAVLIEAMALLAGLHDSVSDSLRLAIAGEGPLRETLAERIGEEVLTERVRLIGYRRDVPALLQAADIFLLPSRREGLNVSVQEAMAAGLPVICGDIRGNRDLIEDMRGGVLLRNVNDAHAFASAIEVLAMDNERRERFGAFNRTRVRTHFSAAQVGEIMNRIYTEAG